MKSRNDAIKKKAKFFKLRATTHFFSELVSGLDPVIQYHWYV